ncbi:unnamed protein product [Spirodela intermedia]|uniref:Uncharacterized protein n=1 Tax=Spirodela intermedia TaxID=51605 RepID=A0A7I8KQ37_SPIIN|nr:unnamed protein product [Spirodela intermedia]
MSTGCLIFLCTLRVWFYVKKHILS